MGRIDSYEAISKFTGNERIVVETDEGTRKALFSQIQDKINDCVDNKAEMLNRNSVSVISDTESEYILDIIVGTTHITTPNLKGKAIKSINIETGHLIIEFSDDTSIDVGVVVGKDYILTEDDKSEIADIAAGRIDVEQIAGALNSTGGLKIFAASDSESAMVFMEKMYADFSTNVPVLFMPLFDDEEFGFQNGVGMIIIDSGSGQLDDAVIIPMSYSEYPFTSKEKEIVDRVKLSNRWKTILSNGTKSDLKSEGSGATQSWVIDKYDDGSSIESSKLHELIIHMHWNHTDEHSVSNLVIFGLGDYDISNCVRIENINENLPDVLIEVSFGDSGHAFVKVTKFGTETSVVSHHHIQSKRINKIRFYYPFDDMLINYMGGKEL